MEKQLTKEELDKFITFLDLVGLTIMNPEDLSDDAPYTAEELFNRQGDSNDQ